MFALTLMSGLVIAALAIFGAIVWTTYPKRQRCKRFEGRSDLTLDQIYIEFFAPKNLPKALVCELWKEVAEPLHLPPGKLRPNDRFSEELAPPKGWEWDDDIVEVQWAGERRLKRSGIKADLSAIKTLGDYVEFFCDLTTQKQQA